MKNIKTNIKKMLKVIGINISYLNLPKAFKDQKKYINKNISPVIFDVGANKGQTYLRYRTLFPVAQIYLFEPFNDPYQALLKEIKNDKLAYPEQTAVSSDIGERVFYLNSLDYTNSLLEPISIDERKTHEHDSILQRRGEIKVKTDTIDAFLSKLKIKNLDILKMDIQGGELEALKGAREALASGIINLIYCEVSFIREYKDQPLFSDISIFLNGFGYELAGIYDEGRDSAGQLLQADAIFLCPRVKK
jgi:FkbM family methyltransferase